LTARSATSRITTMKDEIKAQLATICPNVAR
jgi:hypothetical protein